MGQPRIGYCKFCKRDDATVYEQEAGVHNDECNFCWYLYCAIKQYPSRRAGGNCRDALRLALEEIRMEKSLAPAASLPANLTDRELKSIAAIRKKLEPHPARKGGSIDQAIRKILDTISRPNTENSHLTEYASLPEPPRKTTQATDSRSDDRPMANVATGCEGVGERFFRQIQTIWAPFAGSNRIIPFCTPFIHNPTALVIGMNHAEFDRRNSIEADRIANAFSTCLPTEHTYLDHDHTFAIGLREICRQAGICIDRNWMGTNRCAVQGDFDAIKKRPLYRTYQKMMDKVLLQLIVEIKPKNVILTGKAAVKLFPEFRSKAIEQLDAIDYSGSRIIPVQHASWSTMWALAAERLSRFFVR
jgi:hypothetical protein